MKFIKLDDSIIDEIVLKELDYVELVNDKDDISINDEIEFFNNSNVVFGKAKVIKVTVQNSSDSLNDQQDYLEPNTVIDSIPVKRSILKTVNFIFNVYDEPRKLATNTKLNVMEIKIYADGGSRGNPGPSASGYVLLTTDGQIIKQNGIYLGITTNNQAEYKALLFALKDAVELESKIVDVYMDSLLVINQMKSIYKIKNKDLIPIHQEITALLKHFEKVIFNHVPRELNKLADTEVNKCLDLQVSSKML
jgi:ribonuclease HI